MNNSEIANIINVDRNTITNWKKNKPDLYKIVKEHFEKKEIYPDLNNPEYLKKEILKAIEHLPRNKIKKFYHLMMIELMELGI